MTLPSISTAEASLRTIELRAGTAVVTICPDHGGRIGQIEVDGVSLLRGPEAAHLGWAAWGSYPLLPWSNRIPGGYLRFEGRDFALPVNWPDASAIHGLVASVPWRVVNADTTTADLEVFAEAGPYNVRGLQTFRLTPDALELSLSVTNLGSQRVPVGLGIHPWFRAGEVTVPADLFWPGDTPVPTGPPEPVTADVDLRSPRVPPEMDRCYTGLTEDSVSVPGITLHWSGPVTQVVVYSGEPGWVCVEPVTMANDGFELAERGKALTGVVPAEPGAVLKVTYVFDWSGHSRG